MSHPRYEDKLESLRDLFGTPHVVVHEDSIRVAEKTYPIIEDVIVLLDEDHWPAGVRRKRPGGARGEGADPRGVDREVQFSFGEEWKTYREILPEHEREFRQYFDLVDLSSLRHARVVDLGCGMGRWSYFLKGHCRELVLVDFSEAIFVAQHTLADAPHALFFMGDVEQLPFRQNFCDFMFCLGVLHHLPRPCLEVVRALAGCARRQLYYLYYALDNRPLYFRIILWLVTLARRVLSRIRNPGFRACVSWSGALLLYKPLVLAGQLLRPVGLSRFVPLYEFYRGKSLSRLRQDVYDRFFTSVEQRVTRAEIESLKKDFSDVVISDELPYWHFICTQDPPR